MGPRTRSSPCALPSSSRLQIVASPDEPDPSTKLSVLLIHWNLIYPCYSVMTIRFPRFRFKVYLLSVHRRGVRVMVHIALMSVYNMLAPPSRCFGLRAVANKYK